MRVNNKTFRLAITSATHRKSSVFVRALMAFLLTFCLFPWIGTPNALAEEINTSGPSSDTDAVIVDLDAEAVTNELVITYKDDSKSLDELNQITSENVTLTGQKEVIPNSNNAEAVDALQISDDTDVETAINELTTHPDIAYVEPNYIFHCMQTTTSDPSIGNQDYLRSSGFLEAWDSVKCNGSVTVAVIDDGCKYDHPDLIDNVDTAHAYDATTRQPLKSATTATNSSHGTNVAGVIAATANNNIQIAGASYNAKILPINIFDRWGDAAYSTVLEALNYIQRLIDTNAVNNLKIINASFGAYAEDNIAATMHSMLAKLRNENNILTIAAGGNGDENRNPILLKSYPADYDECISVTSITSSGANSTWSDYNEYKDISAPGEGILTTDLNNGLSYTSGTSFSAPLVSSAAALLFAANPSLTSTQVENALKQTASPISVNPRPESGSKGALNVKAAVDLAKSSQSISNTPMPRYETMYRLYNPYSGEHFYTASAYERDVLDELGWNYEGWAWNAPLTGAPVYRLYNSYAGDHHYTPNINERDFLVQHGWNDEGIGWYASIAESIPLYRLYNPNAVTGTHHYTMDLYEAIQLDRIGWEYEGIGWYGSD